MIDRTAALFKDLDAPRDVPAPARMRLVSALEVAALPPTAENLRAILDRPKRMPIDSRMRLELMLIGEDDSDIAARMQGIDAPAEMTPIARMRLEHRLAMEQRRRAARVWQMTGAAAAAVLVLIGAVVLARPNTIREPGRDGGKPGAIQPSVPQNSPDVNPPVQPPPVQPPPVQPPAKQSPPARVLGVREVRVPAGSNGQGVQAPIFDGGEAGQPAGRRGAPGLSPDSRASLPLTDSVAALLSDVLRALSLDELVDISKVFLTKPSSPEAPAAAPAPAKRSRVRSARTPRATKPASQTAAAPAAPKTEQKSGGTSLTEAVNGVVRELVDVSVISTEVVPAVSIGL